MKEDLTIVEMVKELAQDVADISNTQNNNVRILRDTILALAEMQSILFTTVMELHDKDSFLEAAKRATDSDRKYYQAAMQELAGTFGKELDDEKKD
jgi:hypothetical protein